MTGAEWLRPVTDWSVRVHAARAQTTADTYVRHVEQLAEAMGDVGPWEVTSGRLEVWVRHQPWSRSTRSKVLVSLRAFYAWAMDEGLCSRSPLAGVAIDHRQPGPLPVSPRQEAWRQAIGDYLVWLRAGGRSPGTGVIRRWHLFSLSELYADPWLVTGDDLAQWLARTDAAPEYRRALRGTVRSFYGWATSTGRLAANPATGLQSVLLPRALPRPITEEALSIGVSCADDRQRLILMLAAVAGLRRAEIARVHFRDVVAGQLLVKGKGGHERLVPLHPELLAELRQERRRRQDGGHGSGWSGPHLHPDGWLFPSTLRPEPLTPRYVADLGAACLPAGWTLHTLRHRFATQAYAAQRDLRAVQDLLGHAKPETTARYAAIPNGARVSAVLAAGL